MRRLLLIFAFLTLLAYANNFPTSLANFPNSENPLSQNGLWINGGTVGQDWQNCRAIAGHATGTGASSGFNDNVCVLSGAWGPDQTVQASVFTSNPSYAGENELWVNGSIAAHSITGYEANFARGHCQIVRWEGSLGMFTELGNNTGCNPQNGDVIKVVRSGATITTFLNGVQLLSRTDSTYSGGSPGMGFFVTTGNPITDEGIAGYSATDGVNTFWSGIVASTRAANWTQAGFAVPSSTWTQCGATIAPYTGPPTAINNAITACGNNQYVQLGQGTFTLSSGYSNAGHGHVAVRGMGADKTLVIAQASAACGGISAMSCMIAGDTTYFGSPGTVVNVSAGLTQGSTALTLSSTTGITAGKILAIDQCNDGYTGVGCAGSSVTTNNVFVCDEQYQSPTGGCGSELPNNVSRPHRSQLQLAMVTSVVGNVVNITPGLAMPNWRTGQSVQAWSFTPVSQVGIENQSFEGAGLGIESGVGIFNCYQCWVKGVRFNQLGRYPIHTFQGMSLALRDNYFYKAQSSDSYGIELQVDSWSLLENNIFQQISAPVVINGPATGTVIGYNYAVNQPNGGNFMTYAYWDHTAGADYVLYEGNSAAGIIEDDIHGSRNLVTLFRNRMLGQDTGCASGCSNGTNGVVLKAFTRYANVIGNVMGVDNYHKIYKETSNTQSPLATLELGVGNTVVSPPVPVDATTISTAMLWGNYPACTVGAGCGQNQFNAGEVPTAAVLYPNPVPASQALPASFYTSKPLWWPGTKPWPAIGPDVSGGNLLNAGGRAYSIPALDCFLSSGGPASGSGPVLIFNAASCYPTSSTPVVNPPVNLVITIR